MLESIVNKQLVLIEAWDPNCLLRITQVRDVVLLTNLNADLHQAKCQACCQHLQRRSYVKLGLSGPAPSSRFLVIL